MSRCKISGASGKRTSARARTLVGTLTLASDLASARTRARARARSLARSRVLAQKLEQASTIKDPEQLFQELTRLLPDVYMVLVELLQQLATEPDYPLLRDYGLALLVPDLKQIVEDIHTDIAPELVQASGAYLQTLAGWSQGSCYPGLDTALAALVMPAADADKAQ